MNNMMRNIIAVVVGLIIGGIVNMGLVTIGPSIIPPPAGVDMSTTEGLKEGMKLFEPKNFLFPFLAHALGAFVAAKLAASHAMKCAMIVGVVFLLGGVMMVYMVGGPMWFIAADLGLAYLPMGYLGGLLAGKKGS